KALDGVPRDAVQISTKFGYVLDERRQEHSQGERPQDWSPAHLRESLEQSLRRLGLDHVDLYQLHNPRMDAIDADDLFEVLEWLVEGLQKVERLRFLSEEHDMTMAQAALKFILAQPAIACVLPTITNEQELEEWAAASDKPDLTPQDLERIEELYERNFDVEP